MSSTGRSRDSELELLVKPADGADRTIVDVRHETIERIESASSVSSPRVKPSGNEAAWRGSIRPSSRHDPASTEPAESQNRSWTIVQESVALRTGQTSKNHQTRSKDEPTAFAATEINLNEILDLDRYPSRHR